jgi:replicative DNA helicase
VTVHALEPAALPPQNLDAEESVLGACLIAPVAYFAAIETGIRASDFYRESHGRIFEAIARLSTDGVTPDGITVADELEKTPPPEAMPNAKNMLDAVGGASRIHEIAALVPAASNVKHYAAIVRENATKRDLLRTLSVVQRAALDGQPVDVSLEQFETNLDTLRSRLAVTSNVHAGLKLAERFYTKRLNPPSDEDTGVVAPYSFLSRRRRGSLYVVAGYTGDGKTVTLLDELKAVCAAGHRAGYASLEMTGDELVDRLVSKFGVPYEQAQTGRIDERYVAAAEVAEKTIAGWNFDVFDDEEVDPAKLKRWAVAGKYDVIYVDHLHRIEFADRFEIEKTVRAIRNMAKRLEVPVVLAAQLNRASDKKNPFPRPTLSSLRETAVIEQEAAVVSFVYRERDEETHEALNATEYVVAKNRFGKTGIRRLSFDGARQTFNEVSYR